MSSEISNETRLEYYPARIVERILLCWFILTEIPDEGLEELRETMKEIRDFYGYIDNIPPESNTTTKISANIKEPVLKIDFLIEED